jgi:hypothetical protein
MKTGIPKGRHLEFALRDRFGLKEDASGPQWTFRGYFMNPRLTSLPNLRNLMNKKIYSEAATLNKNYIKMEIQNGKERLRPKAKRSSP